MNEIARMNSTLGFLDLPPEVRIKIYQNLFESAQLSIESPHPNNSPCGLSICSCDFPFHILSTCHQLQIEASAYLLASTTLQLGNRFDKTFLLPESYLASIPRVVILNAEAFSKQSLHLDKLKSLRILELRNITIWCKYHDETYLESPEGEEAMLGLALFNLNRISGQLTMLCRRMDRKFKILLCCQFVVSSLTHETIVRSFRTTK